MSDRGRYGSASVGQMIAAPPAIYVERESPSTAAWILGTIAAGGAILWLRHQSLQIEELYRKADLPYQGLASSLRQSAASALRGLAERARPKRKDNST